MSTIGRRLTFVCVVLLAAQNCWASAWLLTEREIQLELYTNYYQATDDLSGFSLDSKPNDGKYEEVRYELKTEYGFLDNLNGLLYVPFKWARYEDDNVDMDEHGLSDIRFGLTYRLPMRNWDYGRNPLALALIAKAPTGDGDSQPALGQDQWDVEGRMLWGYAFRESGDTDEGDEETDTLGWVGLEAGYRWRDEEPADQIVLFAEGAYHLGGGISLKGELDSVIGLSSTGDEESYLIPRVGLMYQGEHGLSPRVPGNSWQARVMVGRAVWGENTSAGTEVVLSLGVRF